MSLGRPAHKPKLLGCSAGRGHEMSRKKVSTTIYITMEQAEQLKLLHDRTKVPIAVYIREGIDLMLRHYEHILPGQLSLGGSSRPSEPRPTPVAEPQAAATAAGSGPVPSAKRS